MSTVINFVIFRLFTPSVRT